METCVQRQSTLPETDSVYQLITQLCKYELREKGSSYVLKKARSNAFGILLKKTPAAFGRENVSHPPWFDPLFALATLQLDLPDGKASQLAHCLQHLEFLKNVYSTDNLKKIVHFILALSNSRPPQKEDFVSFKPGQLDAEFSKRYPNAYPQYGPQLFILPPVEKFVSTVYGTECPYLPPGGWYPFSEPLGTGLSKFFQIDYQSGTAQGEGVLPYDIPDFPEVKSPKELCIPKASKERDRTPDEGYGTPAAEHANASPECDFHDHHAPSDQEILARVNHRTWEAYGSRLPPLEKPFLSEKPEAIHRLWVLHMRQQAVRRRTVVAPGASHLKVLQMDQLLADIRYLLDGVASDTFPYNKDLDAFTTAQNICVEGISPDTLQNFLTNFLAVGSLIYQLEILVQSPPEGCCLAYQAICECVRHYLCLYRGELLRQKFSGSLLSLANSIRRFIMPQLFCISHVLSQHTTTTAYLLSQLHDAAMQAVCPITAPLLTVMLHAGTSIYLKYVELWLFEGKLDDSQEEFFICVRPTMSLSRTRDYWNWAFYVNKKAVPNFLLGLEHDILDCGRAINLLRICCPKNPLLQELEKGIPHLRLCGSTEQLKQLEVECLRFEERVSEACGLTGLAARDFLLKSQAAKSDLIDKASDARQQHEKKILAEIEEKRVQKIHDKRQQMEQLQAQIMEAKEHRLAERRRQLAEDEALRQLNEYQQQEEKHMKQLEKEKIIMFYEEQSKAADRKKFRAEWCMRRMKLNEKRKKFLSDESLYPALTQEEDTKQHMCTDLNPDGVKNHLETPDQTNNNVKNIDTEKLMPAYSTTITRNVERIENGGIDNSEKPIRVDNVFLESNADKQEMSDAQKNRLKVLQSEFGISLSLPSNVTNQQKDCKDLVTDAERNRFKMMWSEYDIITGNNNITSLYNKTPEMWNMTGDSDHVIAYSESCAITDKINHNFIDTNVEFSGDTTLVTSGDVIRYDGVNNILAPEYETELSPTKGMSLLAVSSPVGVQNSSHIMVEKSNENSNLTSQENGIAVAVELPASSDQLTSNSGQENQNVVKCFQEEASVSQASFTGVLKNDDNTNASSFLSETPAEFMKLNEMGEPVSDKPVYYGLSVFNAVHPSWTFEMPSEAPFPIRDITDRFFHGCLNQESVHYKPETETLETEALQRSVLLPLYIHSKLVNGALLQFFLQDESLLSHLESLRNYFLLQDGEFSQLLCTQLFQGAHESVHSSRLLNVSTLNRVLARAVSGSPQAERDVNSSRLCFSLSSTAAGHLSHTSPNMFSSLVLGYSVEWPLCLILTESALANYNSIFGFLLKVRRIAWVLEQNFKDLKLPANYTRNEHHRIHLCRHEMMQFVHGLQIYIMSTVLQVSWAEFEVLLGNAVSLDDLYRFHASYLKTILYKCLLFEKTKRMMDHLMRVFTLILKFCEMVRSGLKMDDLLKTFNDYQKAVNYWLHFVSRMADSGFQPHFANLVLSLNVSGYYKNV
ncbi:gamma-tubulin complex component 6 [Schistocerca piceifrons]|uniref:gamma-tubulin complex component 6 n=1 Tax=Schistocerca piceifrons TaxID=274613 RepID=UPI001F5FC447|nr:gamma-tubulin complex component 6 [Schistocerca piceifrons]